MGLKALVFALNANAYRDYVGRHHLNPVECKYATTEWYIRGYHRDTHPDLRLIFLEDWMTPAHRYGFNELLISLREFEGRIYHAGRADAAAMLLKLSYITDPECLPEYLSHEDEEVREAGRVKLEELKHDGTNSN